MKITITKKMEARLLSDALAIYKAGVQAARPGPAVVRALKKELRGFSGRVFLLAAGKAALPMAKAALPLVRRRLAAGLVVSHVKADKKVPGCRVLRAGHPLPDAGSLRAGREALALADRAGKGDLFLVLLSGGASALLCAPRPGLSLRQKIAANRKLLLSGLPISTVNQERKKLSLIKGGKLALAARPARILTLAVSDVPGDDPAVIGSGPSYLPQGKSIYRVVASNTLALAGAVQEAKRRGYKVRRIRALVQGEARLAALRLARACRRLPAAACVLAGGETTVTVRGRGRGGRNQEMALAAALALGDRPGLLFQAAGSDGRDGPCPAAGAAVMTGLAGAAEKKGLHPGVFLRDNDAFGFFSKAQSLGLPCALLPEEATGTNVMDLYLGLRGKA